MKKAILVAVATLFAAAPLAQADTLYLADGKSMSGEVKLAKDGSYTLRKNSGTVITYDADQVVCVEFAPTVREEYMTRAKAATGADAHFDLALWCDRNDLRNEAKAELRKTLAADANHELARKAMGYQLYKGQWMTHDETMIAKGFVEYNGNWVTAQERDWMAANDKVEFANGELAGIIRSSKPSAQLDQVRERLALVTDAERASALQAGLLSDDKDFRIFCAGELNSFDTLVRTALHDKDRAVRLAAVNSVQRISQDSPEVAEKAFVDATADERAAVRIAAIDALGVVGRAGSVEVIVSTYRMTLGESARNHIALVKQHAYVEDYDVQVASWAATADPVIGVIQEGSVLDVKPLRAERVFVTVEQNVVRDTFQRITGGQLPQVKSLEEFDQWWSENHLRYTGN